jgi:hypothetical protein
MTGIHINNNSIFVNKGNTSHIKTNPPYLDWLIELVGQEPAMFYHLDANVASLLKLIEVTEAEAKKLHDTHKLLILPYKLTYYPGKYFSVDRGAGIGHPYANFYNAGQYLVAHFEPDEHVDDMYNKAKLAADTGAHVVEVLHKLGLDTDKLTSPIKALDSKLEELGLPTIDDIPAEAAELAYGCIKGNWLEAFSCGYWREAYDYDVNGAYGSELAKLLDLRDGEWVNEKYPPISAKYGFTKGLLTTHANFHPFLLNIDNDMSYTPVGCFETYLTLEELNLLVEQRLCNRFQPEDGWWWIPRGEPKYPLKELVEWLYYQKQNGNGLETKITRRCIAGIWGRFAEFRGKEFGKLFNPVYAAIVESNSRVKVARVALQAMRQGCRVLHIAVDGIITDKPIDAELGSGMGQWRLSHKGKCIIVSSGIVGFEGKHGAEEFSIRFNWLYDQMTSNPEATELTMKKWSPVTLAKALNTDFNELGQIKELVRTIYLEPDHKRVWKYRSANAGEILNGQYESMPIEASMVKGIVR